MLNVAQLSVYGLIFLVAGVGLAIIISITLYFASIGSNEEKL
jgi:hypothetical protein